MSAARLQTLLGLSDEELLTILDSDPLAVITGEEDARPEIRILLQLLGDDPPPRAWLRAGYTIQAAVHTRDWAKLHQVGAWCAAQEPEAPA